jgi:hypothetical protein
MKNNNAAAVTGTPCDDSRSMSYFGRVNYNFNEKYMLSAIMRADGNSKFAPGKRWGYFPSVSAGWVISNEKFMEKTASWLDFLKLRAGWGQNGNQRIDATAPLTLIGTNKEAQWWFGSGFSQGYVPTYQGNQDIKWETSTQTNVGIDLTLLRNSLDLSMDFYVKKTSDMLLQMPIPSFGAYPNSPFFNAGDLKNTIDVMMNTDPLGIGGYCLSEYTCRKHSFEQRTKDLLKIADDTMNRYQKKPNLLGF